MKRLLKYEDKILSCVPDKWAAFYRNAPKEFKQDYITKAGFSREQFLELAKRTKLFDHLFYEQDPSDFVYKEFNYIPRDCESWLLNKKEMELYSSMPDRFSQDEFRAKRLEMGLPIRSQDKMISGTLFNHIAIEGKRYFDLQKGIITPVLK